jgi:hypothetical protein
MKKLSELWTEYRDYTKDFTEHGRKLGFAGAAVCWLFRGADFTFPFVIYAALLAFVGFFSCDMIQMFVAAFSRRVVGHSEEEKIKDAGGVLTSEAMIPFPRWIDKAPFGFFVAKGFFLLLGFGFIAFELLVKLVGSFRE